MTSVAGASRFLHSATLANNRGLAPSTPSLIGDSAISLLDVGRRINRSNIGLSAESRALTNKFLNRSSAINSLFALGTGASLSAEGLQTQILALRSSVPKDKLSRVIIESEAVLAAEDKNNARQAVIDGVLNSVKYKFGLGQKELDEMVRVALRRAGFSTFPGADNGTALPSGLGQFFNGQA